MTSILRKWLEHQLLTPGARVLGTAANGMGLVLTVVCMFACKASPTSEPQPPDSQGNQADKGNGSGLFWPAMFDSSPFDLQKVTSHYHRPGLAQQEEQPVAGLIAVLRNGDDGEREHAALILGEVCFGASLWGTRWLTPNKDDRARMRKAVQQGLTGTRPRVLLPVLIEALDDEDPKVRRHIASVLMHIGPVAIDACPRLRKTLKDGDPEVRAWAARALYFIADDVLDATDASVALLEHSDPEIRSMAAYNICLMGRDGYEAMPFLEKRLSDQDEGVRLQAKQALDAIRR